MSEAAEIWACPHCGTSLDVSELGFYARVICPQCQHEERVHTLIANFLIEGVLGIGGMSVVLRGRDILLNRVVAIKLLNDTYKGEDARIARFERECALMARVRHNNVVSIYSAGWKNGQFYVAMELVTGQNLEELLTDGFCMEQNRAIEIISEVALGLDAASQAGLLHRDMKPGNIILSDSGMAKVLDFGLSLQSSDADDEEMIWATPFYVPPETLRREPEDSRTDIYALGMTLRHLLTGSDRFDYETQTAEDLLYCKEHLPPLCQVNRELAPDLGKLVDHMTAYDPAKRPANYVELLKEIGVTMERIRKKKRVSEYLRSSQFAKLATLALACTIGGYLLSASLWDIYLAPTTTICRDLPATHRDAARYEALSACVQEKNWEAAYKQSLDLSRNAADPDLSAWASLYAWTLCYLNDDLSAYMSEAALQLRGQFEGLQADGDPILPLHDDLMYIKPLFSDDAPSEEVPDALILSHPMVDAMQMIYLANRLKASGDEESAKDYLEQARGMLEQCAPPFNTTLELLPEEAIIVADSSAPEEEEIIEATAPHASEPPPAAQGLSFEQLFKETQQASAKPNLSDDEMLKNQVIMQICRASIAIVAFYERQSPSPAWTGLSQDACLKRAESLSQDKNQQELIQFKCMHLLLSGHLEQARTLSSYSLSKDADAPFTILMEHWLSVLSDPSTEQ
ncbi:MAG: serine/threonine-protein kinase [Akkermansia sp.]